MKLLASGCLGYAIISKRGIVSNTETRIKDILLYAKFIITSDSMDKKQKRWLLLSVGISLAFLFGFLFFTIDTNTLLELQNCNIWFILIALGIHIVSIACWALRIKSMSWSLGYKVPFLHSFNLVCSNMFIASVTPSQVGGEPVRVYELTKAKVPGADATAIVLMERVFDAVILIFGALISILLLNLRIGVGDVVLPDVYMIISYIGIGIFAAALVLFVIVARRPDWGRLLVRKVVGFFLRKFKKKWSEDKRHDAVEGAVVQADRFYLALDHFMTKSKKGIVLGLFWTAIFWFLEFELVSFILMGLGIQPYFVLTFILMVIVTFIMMIPLTPGGAGVAEISMGGLFSLIVPKELLGIFVLIWRLITYYFNLLIGFIASLIILRREAKGKEVKIK